MTALTHPIPRLTFGEEVGNAVSHGVMAALILLAFPYASLRGYMIAGWLGVSGIGIYMSAIFLMFLSSSLYHSMDPASVHKQVFRVLDHSFIFVAIAGSYTPIALLTIGGIKGIGIVVFQWVLVVVGIILKAKGKGYKPLLSVGIYLMMGWTVILFLPTLIRQGTSILLILLVVGGVLYSIGAVIYAKRGFKYHHLVWHLCINLASLAHMVGILFYIR